MLMSSSSTPLAAEPPAASSAFTSHDHLVLKARDLTQSGKFKQAEALLAAGDSQADAASLRARAELADIIRRTRYEYSLKPAGLLAKLRKVIPDE